ncbi:MAG TPA: cyanophycin synthetase, partial [Verrucomicrobiae bacterium]|nr:cyanophycin synthetase [Verrucomicrobiae bacterium]
IERVARKKDAPVIKAGEPARELSSLELPLPGEHQRQNAAVAWATVSALQRQVPVTEAQLRRGLGTVSWPGRLQLIRRPDGTLFLLDGAHNVAGAMTLRDAVRSWGAGFGSSGITLILGILQDKDWQSIGRLLAPLAQTILTVPVSSERTADAESLAEAVRSANPSAAVFACGSFREALARAAQAKRVIVTGSLYLVGEALEIFGAAPGPGESGLNEWTGPATTLH